MQELSHLRFFARFVITLAGCAAALLFLVVPGASAEPPTPYDRVLTVGFSPSASAASRVETRRHAGVHARGALAAPGLQQVVVPAGQSLGAAAGKLRAAGNVDFVELPTRYHTTAMTNDPYMSGAWGLNNDGTPFAQLQDGTLISGTSDADIDAPEAWDVLAAGPEPIAIVDTGVAWQHEDLAANIWTNAAESGGGAGIDDDPYVGWDLQPHTYVDDFRGWDFVGDLNDHGTPNDTSDDTRYPPDNNPADPNGHGTHVAGIAGAVGNNSLGIAGVNPGARTMPLRAADETGSFFSGAIEDAFSYAIDHGVRVVNGSFGGAVPSSGISAIVFSNPNVLFVFAAGNGGDDEVGDDHDAAGGAAHQFPCDIATPNVICVAATDWNDQLTGFSDYGFTSVDLAAPGDGILSTYPSASDPEACITSGYEFLSGTSMAAPFVAGAASLIWSADPALDSSQVKSLILGHTDALPSLTGKVVSGGRLNLDHALRAAPDPQPVATPDTPAPPSSCVGNSLATTPSGTSPSSEQPPPEPVILDTRPPGLRVISAHTRRVGRSGWLKFQVICDEGCSIATTARPNVRGLRSVAGRYSAQAGQIRTVGVRFSSSASRRIRTALHARGRVGVFITVTATDTVGNRAPRRSFRVSLVR